MELSTDMTVKEFIAIKEEAKRLKDLKAAEEKKALEEHNKVENDDKLLDKELKEKERIDKTFRDFARNIGCKIIPNKEDLNYRINIEGDYKFLNKNLYENFKQSVIDYVDFVSTQNLKKKIKQEVRDQRKNK